MEICRFFEKIFGEDFVWDKGQGRYYNLCLSWVILSLYLLSGSLQNVTRLFFRNEFSLMIVMRHKQGNILKKAKCLELCKEICFLYCIKIHSWTMLLNKDHASMKDGELTNFNIIGWSWSLQHRSSWKIIRYEPCIKGKRTLHLRWRSWTCTVPQRLKKISKTSPVYNEICLLSRLTSRLCIHKYFKILATF